MLGNGLRQTLCLADINPAAVASCAKIQCEPITSPSASQSTCQTILTGIPRSEMWNLVVSKPPHFVDQYEGDIRAHDPDWRIDRGFFQHQRPSDLMPSRSPGRLFVLALHRHAGYRFAKSARQSRATVAASVISEMLSQ
jgi:hypothetical protein